MSSVKEPPSRSRRVYGLEDLEEDVGHDLSFLGEAGGTSHQASVGPVPYPRPDGQNGAPPSGEGVSLDLEGEPLTDLLSTDRKGVTSSRSRRPRRVYSGGLRTSVFGRPTPPRDLDTEEVHLPGPTRHKIGRVPCMTDLLLPTRSE